MPSPFPGMDPYLEHPGLWPDVHHELISAIRATLTRALRPRYVVGIEERVYLLDPIEMDRRLGQRVPDVAVAVGTAPAARPARWDAGGGVAVASEVEVEVAQPIVVRTGFEEVREAFLVVADVDTRSIVTVIEVLSPANKLAGSPGLESFSAKRIEIMSSTTHWVEVDLLRSGVSLRARQFAGPCEYLVHVSPTALRPQGKLWPIRLSQRLPGVPIPLKAGDPDVPLDLQDVLTTAYDLAGYDYRIDYKSDPVPPLDPPWSDWADRLLRERKLRTPAS